MTASHSRSPAGSILFQDVLLVDGSGEVPHAADVLVDGDRIVSVAAAGAVGSEGIGRVVTGQGLALSPGFIDMHAHSDLAVVADPLHLAKVSQGITTEVLGQDGIGYAPVDDVCLPQIRTQIAGWNGFPDLAIPWRTMAGYRECLARGTAANTAVLVPQGNLRILAMGYEDRSATAAELEQMCGILDRSLTEGAVGMSSGLTYVPGMYADAAELTALCRVVASHGGYFAPHTRSYGSGALAAYAEAIRIAHDSGCALHLTHAVLNFAVNRDNGPTFLAMIDRALDDGVDVTLDSYPYLPGTTTLAALLPSDMAAGGPEAMLARLTDGRSRTRLIDTFDVTGSDGLHGERADWSVIQISGVGNRALAPLVGRTIADIARDEKADAVDVVIDILVQDHLATTVLMHVGHEHNVQTVMQHPVHCGGSDGILVGDRPHPRSWGTFPRYLSRYVRELRVLTMAECVRHLTSTPARRLGLTDRGLVREGYAADLVLFDPASVHDEATFDEPRQPATGIAAVVVNGRFAYEGGARTAALAGQCLARTPGR